MHLPSFIAKAHLVSLQSYESTNGQNAITYPTTTTSIDGSVPRNITWDPTTNGTVTLVLLKGFPKDLKHIGTIAAKIPNNGSYLWDIPKSLEDSRKMPERHKYGLKIFDDVTNTFEYSPPFDIEVPGSTYVPGVPLVLVAVKGKGAAKEKRWRAV
ncbi:hypothetical protein L873DRAFT_1848334 [Choiromyces venosus 120613-1]|uniref:Yeast cell wall synthesis Kre9/Knh1-like N-terminal domain-containing protein n=1 Tax=Choiromyces venosus 120613-1 TaxID=1336337 RepID=A0A3N4IZM7_9PEZI|nr:hypothetical protein L873DRAFT_1848334 [Choiromyces venosus 120613-1]